MEFLKAITIISIVFAAGMQNPAAALINKQVSQANLESQLKTKQSTQIALNDTYWGPQRDFKLWMPGVLKINTHDTLSSWSARSQTTYINIHRDAPPEVFYLSDIGIRQLLQSTMRESIASKGRVVRSTNLVVDGYPGLELLVQHNDGNLGQYRAFVVKGRIYIHGAVTEYELTTEATYFFDSFRVYPERIKYSG
ncbi:hypothetical protein [Calothrix sp. PCC 7507]|uniref:hypothetical protein n=1 Tax=Calothrix sp. PCC 7507 TaxID=99598 RepID=UPI00029EDE72|nr:hypothetical protein [Calothrix sp. PCC 7507]AFY34368.1 hypothetical protein Cal7507_3982 [Calothrix sp. PCC 7507]